MASRALRISPKKTITSDPDISPTAVDEAAIAARAYELWEGRGRPTGSDQDDWFRAEQELKSGTGSTAS
jgi:hypothetical protein